MPLCVAEVATRPRRTAEERSVHNTPRWTEPDESTTNNSQVSFQPAARLPAGDAPASAGRVEQLLGRRQRPLGPRAAQSSKAFQPQQQGASARAPRKRKAETVEEATVACQKQGAQLFEELRQADLLGPADNFNLACIPPLGKQGEPA